MHMSFFVGKIITNRKTNLAHITVIFYALNTHAYPVHFSAYFTRFTRIFAHFLVHISRALGAYLTIFKRIFHALFSAYLTFFKCIRILALMMMNHLLVSHSRL